jgi:hypothetical protein
MDPHGAGKISVILNRSVNDNHHIQENDLNVSKHMKMGGNFDLFVY